MAQQAPVETVVVTGSRIPQVGLYSSSPVTAVNQQEIKLQGTTNVETLLNNLPGVFADFTQTASNGATGQATVNLRGLGSTRTLVLVDGTRLMPSDPANPVADLNQVPAGLVDHVEVQTGGASAVYGSDAEAGVVNFIMRKDFEGIEIDGQYTVNNAANDGKDQGVPLSTLQSNAGFPAAPKDWWGGASTDTTLILGTNTADGKGNITAYLSYRSIQPILESARDFSACSISSTAGDTKHKCAGSANYNTWLSIDDYSSGLSYSFFQEGNGSAGSGHFVPFTGAPNQRFNYGALNYLQRPDTRYTGGFFAHYEINPQVDVYSDFMFADDHTEAQIAPSGAFLGTGHAFGFGVNVNCANPLMTGQENQLLCGETAGSAFNGTYWDGAGNITPGQSLVELGRRDVEGGNRVDDLRHTSYRMKIGLKGDIGSGWTYDVYGQYGTTIYAENYRNEWSVTRLQNAVQVDPITGNCFVKDSGLDPTCVPIDIFNGFGAPSGAALNYVKAQGFKSGGTEERVVSGAVTGDLGQWGIQSPWAKAPVQVSLGAEYRSESLELLTSRDFQINDLYGQGGATLPVPKSGFNVEEGFGEVRVPLIQDQQFAQDLTLRGAYRYSSYSTAGQVSSYMYGIDWQPIDDFRLRGSFQHATRAPNVLESFTPQNVSLVGGQDPCAAAASPDAKVIANCLANGVPNAGAAILNCPASQCNNQTGGNLGLKPEASDTWSTGIVFTPTFLDGFTATVDYFHIKVADYIGTIDFGSIVQGCYGDGATSASMAFFCPLIHRSAQVHQIWGQTGFVDARTLNLVAFRTEGVDFEANYNTDLANLGAEGMGSLAVNFLGTYVDQLEEQSTPLSKLVFTGYYGPNTGTPTPRWRHKARVTWTSPWDFALSLDWRHIGSVSLEPGTTDPVDSHIGAFDYFDVSGTWTVHTGIELRLGVDNLFDKNPPILDSNTHSVSSPPFGNGNTFPGVYDSLGRTLFIGATAKY